MAGVGLHGLEQGVADDSRGIEVGEVGDMDFLDGKYGLANVAPTLLKLMDIEAPSCWEACMISE